MSEEGAFGLFAGIMELSEAGTWKNAVLEWEPVGSGIADEFHYCVCGHKIKELFYIRNVVNGNEAIVGSTCINKFKGENAAKVARALGEGKLNPALLAYAREEGIIDTRDFKFGTKMCRRRKPKSAAQQAWYDDIERKIFRACRAR